MRVEGLSQIVVYCLVLIALGYPLGLWMARVFTARRIGGRVLGAIENGFLRVIRANASKEQDWKSYGTTVFVFTVLFWAVLYAIQRLQGHLFLNQTTSRASPRTCR
jgi:potassium-transporting ATPase potassium-binding subunit